MSLVKKLIFHITLKKYLIVGLINTLATLLIIYSLKWSINLNDVYANFIGYGVGLIISFNLNKKWIFNHNNETKFIYLRFLFIAVLSYLANLIIVLICIYYLNVNDYISHIFGVPAYTMTGYFGNRFFVFKNK
jgi:putative flippase GtrA